MKYKKFLLIALFLWINVGHAQNNTFNKEVAAANLRTSADDMAALFVAKDYDHYTKYLSPAVVKAAGGKDKMIATIKQSLSTMEKQGATISNLKIGKIGPIIVTEGSLQAVVPELLTMKVTGGKLNTESSLIGLSFDQGKTWVFLDTSDRTLKEMQKMFPRLSSELVIPAKQQPKFTKE